jgi:hypothetical protein
MFASGLRFGAGIAQCETCMRSSSVVRDGAQVRFCSPCHRFHPLEEFDGDKRTCKVHQIKLANRRHRKMEEMKAGISAMDDEGAQVPRSGNVPFTGDPNLQLSCAE